jgi:hypothetical protein
MASMSIKDFVNYWGSTPAERALDYPCDRYVTDPDDVLFRAVSVRASRAVVFRWLCQLRVAPYSYDWIDNRGVRSPRELTPGLEELAVGQRVAQIFTLVEFARDEHLTLEITNASAQKAFGNVVITYAVRNADESDGARGPCVRLLAKLLVKRSTHFPYSLFAPALPLGDLIMMRKQLLTFRALCEKSTPLP